MKELIFEQRSEEWFNARLGLLTASKFDKLMTTVRQKPESLNKVQMSVLFEKGAEISTGQTEETFTSKEMQWGIDHEDSARDLLSFTLGLSAREAGLFKGEFYGASPDGILLKDYKDYGTIELKCPMSKTHLKYLHSPSELFSDYKYQVLGQMLCTGLNVGYIASYDPRFNDPSKRLAIYEVTEEDKKEIPLLKSRLEYLAGVLKDLTK